jgi:hypothetical protein
MSREHSAESLERAWFDLAFSRFVSARTRPQR